MTIRCELQSALLQYREQRVLEVAPAVTDDDGGGVTEKQDAFGRGGVEREALRLVVHELGVELQQRRGHLHSALHSRECTAARSPRAPIIRRRTT